MLRTLKIRIRILKTIKVEAVEESIIEPIEDAIEEIENGEGIITATEVEDDEPFINLGERS